jgi:hypothetical protein
MVNSCCCQEERCDNSFSGSTQAMKKICLFLVMFIFFFTGCGEKRNTSTPAQALIGHWRSNDEKDMFFSEEGRLVVLDGKGYRLRCKYKVSEQNVGEKSIYYTARGCVGYTKKLSDEKKWGYNSARVELRFSPDYKSAQGIIIKFPTYVEETLKLNYVNGSQKP